MKPDSVSVILTTYEEPEWLEKVLWGWIVQTHRDFDLVIGDDGSGPATAVVIDRVRGSTSLEIRHVWQEDRGFRKSTILNKAILAARGEYLVFSDGDCIPRADFLETHLRLAEPRRFLSGGALRLPHTASRAITPDDVTSGRAFRLGWLVRHGWRPGHRVLRLQRSRRLGTLLDRATPTRASWNGGNASTWREHVIEANGFEEEMGYKGQDRAFGERLEHLGIRGKQIRHRAVLLHLEHHRSWVDPAVRATNEAIRERVRQARESRARIGLAEVAARGLDPGDSVR